MLAFLFALSVQCHVGYDKAGVAYPDPHCTPGATVKVTKEALCVKGYAKGVRNVPTSEKKAVFAAYGITSHPVGRYEVDHLISLELGGANSQDNLWPEASTPKPGFHQKDTCENKAHELVCSGEITLEAAQQGISKDWLSFCRSIKAVQ